MRTFVASVVMTSVVALGNVGPAMDPDGYRMSARTELGPAMDPDGLRGNGQAEVGPAMDPDGQRFVPKPL